MPKEMTMGPLASKLLRPVTALLLALGAVALAGCGSGSGAATEAAPLVNLDANDATAGTATWSNSGSLGSFSRVGSPPVVTVAGARAVKFNGTTDSYTGPKSV